MRIFTHHVNLKRKTRAQGKPNRMDCALPSIPILQLSPLVVIKEVYLSFRGCDIGQESHGDVY